jgi:hypothetical protein
MFVVEIEDPVIADEPWQTADNFSLVSTGIDDLELVVEL